MNICLVSVELPPPDKKIDIITSSNDVRNANKAEIIIENFICCYVIEKNSLILYAPKLLATNSWFKSYVLKAEVIIIITIGTANTV